MKDNRVCGTRGERRARRSQSKRIYAAALACSVAAPLCVRAATPTIRVAYDLRLHGTGAKEVEVANLGDVVTVDLFATTFGDDADTTNDGLISASGSFKSSAGGLMGNILTLTPPAPYNSSGSQLGTQRDLDGDGDLDAGGTDPATSSGYYAVRSSPPPFPQPTGGFFVGQMQFSVTALAETGTQLTWAPRNNNQNSQLILYDKTKPLFVTPTGVTVSPLLVKLAGVGDADYLAGTIDAHVTVSRLTRPTPGGATLLLTKGLDVTAAGTLDTRDTNGFGPHGVQVNDATSGNAGGSLFVGTLQVGTTSAGTFVQTGSATTSVDTLTVGAGAGATGTLDVRGGVVSANVMRVGGDAPATVRLSGGAVVNADTLVVANTTAAGGSVLVNDGATLRANQPLVVGSGGAGEFVHSSGVTELTTDLSVGGLAGSGGTGLVTLSGGTIRGRSIRVGDELFGSFHQTGGTLDLRSTAYVGGVFSTSATNPANGGFTLDAGVVNVSNLFLGNTGDGTIVQNGGTFNALGTLDARGVRSGEGIITVSSSSNASRPSGIARYVINGGTVFASKVDIGKLSTSPGELYIAPGGTLDVGSLTMTSTSKLRMTGGLLRVSGKYQSQLLGDVDFGNAEATVEVGRGGMVFNRPTCAGGTTIVARGGGLLSFPAGFNPYTAFKSIDTDSAIQYFGIPVYLPPGKTLAGSPSLADGLDNQGTVSPGNSPGVISVTGQYRQFDGASLAIEIGGVASSSFDRLDVDGSAILDGFLNVSLLDGFVPAPTDSFTILTATAGRIGMFDNVVGGKVQFAGGQFDVTYSSSAVTLGNFSSVPEPGAGLTILAMAATGLAQRRRRRGGDVG